MLGGGYPRILLALLESLQSSSPAVLAGCCARVLRELRAQLLALLESSGTPRILQVLAGCCAIVLRELGVQLLAPLESLQTSTPAVLAGCCARVLRELRAQLLALPTRKLAIPESLQSWQAAVPRGGERRKTVESGKSGWMNGQASSTQGWPGAGWNGMDGMEGNEDCGTKEVRLGEWRPVF